MAGDGGTRAVVAALLANTGIAVTKFIAFALARNSSMLAEAIHSCADAGNQVLLLLGGKRAKRAATPRAPVRLRPRALHLQLHRGPIVLFSVGGLFALYEAYHKYDEIHSGHFEAVEGWKSFVPVVVLVVAIMPGELLPAHRDHRDQQGPRRRVVRQVHPPREVARAAGDPARGRRRPARPASSPSWAWG